MATSVKRVVVWRNVVENQPGTMARVLEALSQQMLELVIGYDGSVIDIAPVVGRKAIATARRAGFEPLPTPMVLLEGADRLGVVLAATRAFGAAGISMDSVVAQAVGKKYRALFGFASDADAKKAAAVAKKVARGAKGGMTKR